MADKLAPCCQKALDQWVQKIYKTIVSYPVIQQRPCPQCKRIVPIRVYAPPESSRQQA